ncbi:MAG: phage regulatory protein/antirepressor Ant [Paracoccus sp. (in: a-proteobacteria)]|nr:phage regulatory protein/antirepressor Ant [Paracoccus sp. (in: a-proteobacteria)]
MNIIAANSQIPTMSSREIADLCEKRHDHVLRDIEKMLQDIADPKFGASDFLSSYTDSTGRTLKEYRLPKDLTVTLITGYRADLRYKVVKRLEELEAQAPKPAMLSGPQLMAAALIEADATIRAQSVEIEAMREDVAAHERLTKADGSLNVTEAAKNLGVRPKDLFDWLSHNVWIYKRPNSSTWLGYQPRCNQGLLEHKTTTVLRSDGSEKITEQVRVTAKGLSALAKLIHPSATLIA